jgi:hypothetical protein
MKTKTLSKTEVFEAPAMQVFRAIDDLGVTGMHMTESSMMMMGSKLDLKFLTSHRTGLGFPLSMDGQNDGNENGLYRGGNEMD